MQRKKGISLIVLIITIIVMIILASAVILTINNTNIMDRAKDAVDASNEAEMKNLAMLAWSETYLEGTAKTDEEFETAVEEYMLDAGVTEAELNQYAVVVTKSGVELKKGWLQKGLEVIKGDTVLTIGDTITYDETKGGTVSVVTDVDWKVLGANEAGELLILSDKNIASTKQLVGKTGYTSAISVLDAECVPYAQGEGSLGARSLTAEDVNKITGFNPKEYVKNLDEFTMASQFNIAFGEKIDFSWTEDLGVMGTKSQTERIYNLGYSEDLNMFNESDNTWFVSTPSAGATIGLMTYNSYSYGFGTGSENDTNAKLNDYLPYTHKASKMLFGEDCYNYLFRSTNGTILATRFAGVFDRLGMMPCWGLMSIYLGSVNPLSSGDLVDRWF